MKAVHTPHLCSVSQQHFSVSSQTSWGSTLLLHTQHHKLQFTSAATSHVISSPDMNTTQHTAQCHNLVSFDNSGSLHLWLEPPVRQSDPRGEKFISTASHLIEMHLSKKQQNSKRIAAGWSPDVWPRGFLVFFAFLKQPSERRLTCRSLGRCLTSASGRTSHT